MRIGIFFGARREVVGFNTLVERASHAERDGLSHFWVPHLPTLGYDALTALAIIARQTSRIALGTAVVPVFAEHPLTLASMDLLAGLYQQEGKNAEAEPLLANLAEGRRHTLGAQDASTAQAPDKKAAAPPPGRQALSRRARTATPRRAPCAPRVPSRSASVSVCD